MQKNPRPNHSEPRGVQSQGPGAKLRSLIPLPLPTPDPELSRFTHQCERTETNQLVALCCTPSAYCPEAHAAVSQAAQRATPPPPPHLASRTRQPHIAHSCSQWGAPTALHSTHCMCYTRDHCRTWAQDSVGRAILASDQTPRTRDATMCT